MTRRAHPKKQPVPYQFLEGLLYGWVHEVQLSIQALREWEPGTITRAQSLWATRVITLAETEEVLTFVGENPIQAPEHKQAVRLLRQLKDRFDTYGPTACPESIYDTGALDCLRDAMLARKVLHVLLHAESTSKLRKQAMLAWTHRDPNGLDCLAKDLPRRTDENLVALALSQEPFNDVPDVPGMDPAGSTTPVATP